MTYFFRRLVELTFLVEHLYRRIWEREQHIKDLERTIKELEAKG